MNNNYHPIRSQLDDNDSGVIVEGKGVWAALAPLVILLEDKIVVYIFWNIAKTPLILKTTEYD